MVMCLNFYVCKITNYFLSDKSSKLGIFPQNLDNV